MQGLSSMDVNSIHMTDEYAAQHFHRMGWMWGRLEVMREQQTWGDLKAKRIEKELREKIALEVATLQNWTDKDQVLNTIRNGL